MKFKLFPLILILSVAGLIIVLTSTILHAHPLSDQSLQIEHTFDFSLFDIPTPIQQAIITSVTNRPSQILTDGTYFIVGNYVQSDSWVTGLITSAQNNEPPNWANSIWFIGNNESEIWTVALQGTDTFTTLIEKGPESFIPNSLRQNLLPTTPNMDQADNFKFPWHHSQTWKYTSSWHGDPKLALDFAPYNVPSEQQNWLSSGDGYLVSACGTSGDGYQSFLRVENSTLGNMTYGHLDASTIPLDKLKSNIVQGQYLGKAYDGTQGEGFYNIGEAWPWPSCNPTDPSNCNWGTRTGCCYLQYKTTCGAGTGAHFHWVLPSQSVTVDNWTVSSDGIWRQSGKSNRYVNSLFNDSTNGEDSTPPTISCSTPTSNLWYKTNQTISCTASDPESGVSYMKWGWNDASPDNQINSSSLSIDLEGAPQGQNQFYVQAWNSNNVPSSVKSYGWFGYDIQPPLNPTSTNSGCGAANNVWQNSCNAPNFSWSGASDRNGIGVKDYHYYWGTNPVGGLTTFTSIPSFNPSAVSGPVGVYYLRLATRDQLDQESSPSTLFVLRYDASQPTTSVRINNGSATTNQVNVWLDMTSANTGSGVDQVRISNNGTDWTTWQSYQATLLWTIPALDRRDHTVYVQVKDKAGNISATASDEIRLDLYPVMPHSANYRICIDSLNAAGSADPSSNTYTLVSSIGQVWSNRATGNNLNEQSGFLADMDNCLPIEHAVGENYQVSNWVVAAGGGLRGSTNYTLGDTTGEAFASEESQFSSASYQLASGFWANVSLGIVGQPPPPTPTPLPVTPTPTATPGPTATPVPGGFGVSINSGDLYTNDAEVTVNLSAPNVTQMRLSNDGGYVDEGWTTYQPITNWQITTFGNYVLPRLVYVWFKDADGIIYGTYFDDIIYDPVAPKGSVTVLGSNDSMVDLLLSAADDNSGVTQMKVGEDANLSNVEWQAYEESISIELIGDTVYVQFRDAANNDSPVYSTKVNTGLKEKVYLPMITR